MPFASINYIGAKIADYIVKIAKIVYYQVL